MDDIKDDSIKEKMNTKVLLFSLSLIAFLQIYEVFAIAPLIARLLIPEIKDFVSGNVKKIKDKVKETIKENIGRDISIGDLTTMNVEMVTLVEPFENHSVVTEYLAGKAEKDLGIVKYSLGIPIDALKEKIIAKVDEVQKFFSELVGLYMILNESDTSLVEVLLSTTQCVLTREDKYLAGIDNPCSKFGLETFEKIVKRFSEITKIQAKNSSLKVPGQWNRHLRQVFLRLDQHSTLLSSKLQNEWNALRDLIQKQPIY